MRLKKILAALGILAGIGAFVWAAWPRPTEKAEGKIVLRVWGIGEGEYFIGTRYAVKVFERLHPNIEVQMVPMGGGMDPQKLMTAIAAGTPPDVIRQDRFSVADWASRDAFIPLDNLIKKFGINPKDFYPACWNEAVWRGHVYAIPCNTDCRALYWNKEVFREAGLDPERPPRTWDELFEYAVKLTKYDRHGNFVRVGFIPMYGNSWLYLYGWQNGGRFMTPDGRRCTLNHPRIVEALEFIVKLYDALKGAEALNAFQATFGQEVLDPFIIGKVAMKIDGNWYLNIIARYKPDLDFGVAPAPVPKGRPYITWSGGFSYAIPRGAKHVNEAMLFIKFMTSVEGHYIAAKAVHDYNAKMGRPFIPEMTANIKADEYIFRKLASKDPKFRNAMRLFLDLMKVSRFRPVTPVAQLLWDEHVRATDLAIYHKMTPKEALDFCTKKVQKQLDRILNPPRDPIVNWRKVALLSAICCLITFGLAVGLYLRRTLRLRLLRPEAVAGPIFASPWVLGFLVFTIGPIIASLVLSFCRYDVLHPARFVGFRNYAELVKEDPLFWKSLWNTTFMVIFGVPANLIVSLTLALLLTPDIKGCRTYRTIFYLPSIVPLVAASLLWMWIFNPEFGLLNAAIAKVNELLEKLHVGFALPQPKWLGQEQWAKPALIIMGLWGVGGSCIIWIAGLKGISSTLYEAAEIDGATWWQKFRYVTLPMLTPYIFFNLIMGTIGAFQIFAQAYIMTQGGPVDATLFYVYYLFNNAFRFFRMGYACAMAWILFIVILALTMVQVWLGKRWVYYEAKRE